MNSLEEIIKAIMAEVEANPSAPIEEVLRNFALKNGVSEETVKEMDESFETLTAMDVEYHNLEKARANGQNRSEWVEQQIEEATAQCDEKSKGEIIDAIQKGTEEALINITKE